MDNRPQRSFVVMLFSGMMTICAILLGLIAGFICGDSYGRKNAQFDNPVLRDYYAGKCYNYWENQFKQTLNASLEKGIVQRNEENRKLLEIYGKVQDLERVISDMTLQRRTLSAQDKNSGNARYP